MNDTTVRAQWPHTLDDIVRSLDGIWGLVGATDSAGNLLRLERSLHEPLVYIVTEYKGHDETDIVRKLTFDAHKKTEAINTFAQAIGFQIS